MTFLQKINKLPSYLKILLILIVFLLSYSLVVLTFKKAQPSEFAYVNNNFNVFGLNIPTDLMFCGEKIPGDNYEIRTNLEKEFFNNVYWKNNSAILFNKIAKWFPYIEPILKQEGVPDDIKYIAVIESHLSNEISPAGAAGFWQLVPSTARNYGLIVNDEVDERLDVERSTHAACKLFKEAHKRLNNWTLSAAAYNLGIGGIERALKEQKTNNYYDLLLNRETGEFIYRVLAYKTLLSSPIHFGIKKTKIKYLPKMSVKVVTVDTSITDLTFLAKKYKCSKAQIQLLNPWLLKGTIHNVDGHPYKIKLPKNSKKDYSSYYSDLLSEDGYINETSAENDPKFEEQTDTLKPKQIE